MKKLLIVLGISATILACNTGSKTGDADDTAATSDPRTPGEKVSAAAQQSSVDTNVNKIGTSPGIATGGNGEQLISQSDCLTCHKANERLIGPSYIEVADKYEDNDKSQGYLAEKIIKGGSGVWGEIPMVPHPTISQADANEMAAYIMSLKTN